MTSTLKLYGGIALLLILVALSWSVVRWDNNRLAAQYTAGEEAERAKWTAAQIQATADSMAAAQSQTLDGEAITDAARAQANASASVSAAATQTTIEKINDAFEAAPPVACHPDDRPAPLPVGVLEGLDQARSAALGQAAPAPGRL